MLVIQGSTGTPKGTPWGPGLDFPRIVMNFEILLGVVFYESGFVFFVLWLLFCNVGFEVCFFVGLGEEMTLGSVVG